MITQRKFPRVLPHGSMVKLRQELQVLNKRKGRAKTCKVNAATSTNQQGVDV